MLSNFVIVLDPRNLPSADADLRYLVPDAIEEHSGGIVQDDGYTYGEDNCMHVFLKVSDRERGLAAVLEVLTQVRFKGSNLSGAVVGVREGTVGPYVVVHPSDLSGEMVPEVEA